MAICPSFIGARALRVTRLDSCGRPVYGSCSQVVSTGLVTVEISPEVEEGEDYTQRNAAGELCVSERGPDALTWFTVSIEFCQVDPQLFTLMNPTWKTVTNAQGEITGFRIGTKFTDREGFALELWPKVTAQGALCDDDAPDDAEPNGYFLLPYVLGTAPDSWTLEDGVATFTLTGRTKGGSQWGRGPYNVTHDAQGNPTTLLQPIDSGATSGDPDHFHADIVTLAPPEASCGCQPLEAIAPGAVGGEITTETGQPNRACFEVSGSAGRRVTIDWGDGSDQVTSRVGREECHLYTTTGTFTVTVADIDDPSKATTYEVTIDEVPVLPEPDAAITPDTGPAPLATQLRINNHGNGRVIIDWGDGTPTQTVDGNAADNNGSDPAPVNYPHQFIEPGTYTVTVTAEADERSSAEVAVTVQSTDLAAPTAAATADPTDSGFTLNWEWEQGPGPAATGFEVAHRVAGTTNWTTANVTGADSRSHALSGLSAATEYEARVRATNASTSSEWSDTVTATTSGESPETLAAPTAVEAAPAADPDALAVTWEWAQGEGVEATGFEVRTRPDGSQEWSAPEAVSDPEARSHEVTGLEGATTYDVGVTAVGAETRSDESTGTGTTDPDPATPVAAPTAVEAAPGTDPGTLDVTWEWAQGEGPAAEAFDVVYRTPAGEGEWSAPDTVGDPEARSHEVTGLEAATEYEVGVIAHGDDGSESDPAATTATTAE